MCTVPDRPGGRGAVSGLVEVFDRVPDPRKPRGRRHSLAVVLTLATCAVLAGARSFTAIGEWAADAGLAVADLLGIVRVPDTSTFRRVFTALDADALDTVLGAWATAVTSPAAGMQRRVAVDGKTVRGSRAGDSPGRHLLAALDHDTGVVLGQVAVDAKTNEIPTLPVLLAGLDLTGVIVTADALHTQTETARWLVGRGAHYVLTVKANQPSQYAQLAALPWGQVRTTTARTVERGHGRCERRTVKATEVRAGLLFPHAVQAVRITRRRQPLTGGPAETEVAYLITSVATHQASPSQLAAFAREHWHVENRLRWVRDVTFGEDLSQIRTGHAPQVMASLRNLAIAILRLTGVTNIAAGTRHHARRPERPLQTIMKLAC
ncbi:ISAs1 family transposase [Parafrankia sp. EUN1f]|uniref:ISAs1 family transposase n=1 Tax=Parafrankia sp. EUN1f TaxID=102897 RepID=UPI0001C43B06|nr:ISAs1 family transposase [Parafrankia sp. EUN1f]EFC82589.1 transposase IS4 family protein [Parafrankia sp. EUN1f]